MFEASAGYLSVSYSERSRARLLYLYIFKIPLLSHIFLPRLRPGSSNLLCHTGRSSYRPHHDTTAAQPPRDACTQAYDLTEIKTRERTV